MESIEDFLKGILLGLLIMSAGLLYIIPTDQKIWYPKEGIVITSKSKGTKYGKYNYSASDAFEANGEKSLTIRTNSEWNVGDTVYLRK